MSDTDDSLGVPITVRTISWDANGYEFVEKTNDEYKRQTDPLSNPLISSHLNRT
jgi:hypothetical protein